MVASVRSMVATPVNGSPKAAARGAVAAGDVLLLFHSSDAGSNSGLGEPSGGGTWSPSSSLPGGNWAGSKIWARVASDEEPETYGITQGTGADGVVTIVAIRGATLADLIILPGDPGGPGATPATASGVVLHYGAGVPFTGAQVSWGQPPGYSCVQAQSAPWTTAILAARAFSSSAPVEGVSLQPSSSLHVSHGFTVLVASSTSSSTPTPIPFPAFTPVRGITRMRYTVHDALTGGYRGDISPSGISFGRRDGEADGWSGFCPMPSAREGDRLAEIIPRDPEDLSSGPGSLVVHSWRAGVLWGIHWIHTAEIVKSGRLGLGMQLSGATLDGYMSSVALEEAVEFGGDQIDNARDFILHLGQDPRSNMGFTLQPGTSGTVRPLVAAPGPNVTYGSALRDYARTDGGFSYVINPTVVDGAIQRRWVWGAPRLDFPDELVTFTEGREGGEVIEWREVRSVLRGGTRFGVWGGTPPATDATQSSTAVRSALIETPHLVAGHPIVDQRLTHPGASTDVGTLDDYARYYASTAAGAPRVFSATVLIGRGSDFHPNMIGGYARFLLNNHWHKRTPEGGAAQSGYQRILAWSLTPGGRGSGKDRLQVITETPGVGA